MDKIFITVNLTNYSIIPSGSTWRGDGVIRVYHDDAPASIGAMLSDEKKRVIFIPDVDSPIPYEAVYYFLSVNGHVIDALVPVDFVVTGTVIYDSLNNIMLDEPFIHNFEGWEV